MEQSIGQDSVPPSGSIDKSRVLNVKPLRSLVPVFTSSHNLSSAPQGAPPFVCAPPSGPFPNGVAPFYPFFMSSESQGQPHWNASASHYSNPISDAVPLNSFRTSPHTSNGDTGPSKRRAIKSRAKSFPQSGVAEENESSESLNQSYVNDGEDSTSRGKRSGRSGRRARGYQDINAVSSDAEIELLCDKIFVSFNDTQRRADGDIETVGYILVAYNLFRRRISQIDEAKIASSRGIRRPDLRAATLFLNKGIRTNLTKRIGTVPGVGIGYIFFMRMELCLVGLHYPSMAGIDYLGGKKNTEEESLAVSIVSSGGYDDDADDADVLIYSGQGGINRKDNVMKDQKLERGNLALNNSSRRGNEIRVIRGVRNVANATGKIYVYDGLYKVQESWVEKGKSACSVFKYKLIRLPGQTEAFRIWKSIDQWRGGVASRVGVILPDLTSGSENIPVTLINDVDGEKGPAHFTYISSLKYSKPVNSIEPATGCICTGGCLPGHSNCPCIQKNGGILPYTPNGLLVNQKSLLLECGVSCKCPSNCRNRTSQGGLKLHLEVFKTKDRGWGLRSLDPIRAGAFICEYAGEVIDNAAADDDDFIFDITHSCQPLGVLPGDSIEDTKIPFPLKISAKYAGNVARFMNHSCSPNVLWQLVLCENQNECDLHISFYAVGHIPPLTELTYDYGMVSPEKEDQRKQKCLCGSSRCRGYIC